MWKLLCTSTARLVPLAALSDGRSVVPFCVRRTALLLSPPLCMLLSFSSLDICSFSYPSSWVHSSLSLYCCCADISVSVFLLGSRTCWGKVTPERLADGSPAFLSDRLSFLFLRPVCFPFAFATQRVDTLCGEIKGVRCDLVYSSTAVSSNLPTEK